MGEIRSPRSSLNIALAVSFVLWHVQPARSSDSRIGDLQIEDIIPRDPSPVLKSPAPLEKRDIEKLSLEEAHERLRRQARNEEGLQAKIKREKRDVAHVVEDSSDDDVAITEVSSRNKRQRLSSTVRENVIEVSDDE